MRHLLAMTSLLVLACGNDPPPAAPGPKPASAVKKEIAPATPEAPAIEYSFSSLGKRDPFRSPVTFEVQNSPGEANKTGCDEPLCQFDLDELSVVAVVSGDSNPLAMVEDKAGTGHMVRRNTKMGRNGGKVTQILRECVVVTSYVTGPDGKAQPNKQEMCVKIDSQSAPPTDLLQGKPYQ
jgi:type IV pilus assembly protein PilP